MEVPKHALGGDLVWWREDGFHTTVTLWEGAETFGGPSAGSSAEVSLQFWLCDPSGAVRHSWTKSLRRGVSVTVNSTDYSGLLSEGVLAIFAIDPGRSNTPYRRLFSMVDWYSEEGDLVSLHSDHSLSSRTHPIEFTEIVLLETAESRNFLVLINGAEDQKPGSVTLRVRNYKNEMRQAVYCPEMKPFSLHKLGLRELFPDLAAFCNGQHVTLEGEFDARGLFGRPYVMTEGGKLAGYHGGDRYRWSGMPGFLYRALGHGEVNPMVAIHSETMTTTVNLLHSHGDVENDFFVDAKLYDQSGKIVAHRERWLLARRGGLSRGDVAELLEGNYAFTGHIALNFSEGATKFYPRRLQALLEYRTSVSTARVMAWSDIWNGRAKVRQLRDQLAGVFPIDTFYGESYLGPPEVIYRCHYRVWCKPPIVSYISITNCSVDKDYRETVPYVIRLFNAQGKSLTYDGTLAPYATDYWRIDEFIPGAMEFLSPGGIGVASVESRADLAVMHFSHHLTSGVFSAEHFLASANYYEGEKYSSSGA